MWPVILTTYNLPLWLCMKESYLMLMLLIPDPTSPGKDINVYLRPLINDLKDLWALKGVKTIDVATGQTFNMRAMLLWTINDFPARSSLSGWSGQDTTKARQGLKNLGIQSELWLGQNKMRSARSLIHSKWNRKKFCQFIKGVKLPDGFGSNFKHKVTDNDSNITGLKSHDCHIMMQHLLPYGLQQYLHTDVGTPIIELCSFFKQICSQTLMEADMVKAQSHVVVILCNLEVMIHLVIHLPQEALEGGSIPNRWMYPFERYMKKLKNYVRNKAKPEGSIAEGYVAEEALTFNSHYSQDVTIKFNRPDQLKKVIWYVLHNSPEIDTYQAKFKSEFPNQDMKEEFRDWFGSHIHQRYIDKDPSVSARGELFALACGPTSSPISLNFCVVNGVSESFKDDQYILATQVKQVFYLEDMARRPPNWKVIQDVNHKKFSNEGVIVVKDDYDVIHFDNSYDLALSTSLNDLDFATLNIDGQSMYVDALPDIIDVDEDDDFINDEDVVPHDFADFDDEVLANDDNDDVAVMSADVARDYGGDDGGDDRPPSCRGGRKPNRGGRKAGRLGTRGETRNLRLKKLMDEWGPQKIRFEFNDRGTLIPLGDHATQWSNLIGEIIREFPMHYPSWHKIKPEKKAGFRGTLRTHFDLTPHMQSKLWPKIQKGIEQHLAKVYVDNKSSLKKEHWVLKPDGIYDLSGILPDLPQISSS
ncbi:hypothetical protein Tco_0500566 [Tanacetum coccineum]